NEGTPLNFKANLGGLLNINIINARALIQNAGLNIDIKDGGNGDNRLYFSEIGNLASAGNYSNLVSGSFTGTIQSVVPLRNGAPSPDLNPNPASLASNEGWVSVAGLLQNLTNGFDFQSLGTSGTPIHHSGPAGQAGTTTGVDDPLTAAEMTGSK